MKNKILSLTKKNKKVLLIITMLLFTLTTLLSYAYLNSISSDDVYTNITGTGTGYETLTFTTSGDINQTLNLSTFGANADNLVFTIESSVTALAKPSGDLYEDTYNVYLVLTNDFIYSDGSTPELLLNITKPDSTVVTSLSSLDYVSVNGLTGFDITEENGTIELFLEEAISTSSEVTDEWIFTITLIAHDYDQSANEGANFNASIYLSNSDEPTKTIFTLAETILIDNAFDETGEIKTLEESIELIENKETPDFSETAIEDDGIFATEDNDGTSYYFRGNVEDNYIEFAGILWRIVRIDGNGNVKLMFYNDEKGNCSTDLNVCYSWENVEYKENGIGATYYNIEDNTVNYSTSNAKELVDDWYENLFPSQYYEDFIVESDYCIETEVSFYDEYAKYYIGYNRLSILDPVIPTLKCDSEYIEKYYAGLISADELAEAGSTTTSQNFSFFLSTNYSYWSLTPMMDGGDIIGNFFLSNGGLLSGAVTNIETSLNGLYPTITINSSVEYSSASGTKNDPYYVFTDNFSLLG